MKHSFRTRLPKELPNQIYLLKIESNIVDTPIYKIGMTTNIQSRIKGLNAVNKPSSTIKNKGIVNTITAIHLSIFMDYSLIACLEKHLHHLFKESQYLGEPVLVSGNSELFYNIGLEDFIQKIDSWLECKSS